MRLVAIFCPALAVSTRGIPDKHLRPVRTEAVKTLLSWLSRSSYTDSSREDNDRSNSVDKSINIRECFSNEVECVRRGGAKAYIG
ncbi:hypothetical protein EI94DRAFT_491554 [Lactarius quietus]|nr:hypothetical protein EI94DRAFT_491554 [Lactarius quietus]